MQSDGGSDAAVFAIPVRVYYQDTDAGGVVFHAQYFAFMERARTEFLNARHIDLARLVESTGVLFLVHHIEARFHAPARLNERLSVGAEVVKSGRARLVFRHRVEREGQLLVEAEVTLAMVGRESMKPTRMPEQLRTALDRR